MKKSIVKEGSKTIKSKKNPSPMEYQEPFVPVVRKELSAFGKICVLGFWGLLTFVAGIKMTQTNNLDAARLSQLEKKMDVLGAGEKTQASQLASEFDERMVYIRNDLEKKYENKLFKLTKEQQKIDRQKQSMIESMKDELNRKKVNRSVANYHNGVIPYSYKNADILRFKFRQKVSNLKDAQKNREEKFLSNADLSIPENRSAFKSLEKQHELELYSLERTHRAELRKFRKDRFYVKAD